MVHVFFILQVVDREAAALRRIGILRIHCTIYDDDMIDEVLRDRYRQVTAPAKADLAFINSTRPLDDLAPGRSVAGSEDRFFYLV